MGAGIAAVGAIASLGQMGYGMYQSHKTKQAMNDALAEAKAQGKPVNAFDNMRIANEAYASQEQQNAQTEANLVDAITQSGASAVIGGVPRVQQQMNALNADVTSQKARDLQNIELQKANAQQGIDNDYANWLKQLNMMQIQGAGAANSQANQMIWQGVGGLTNTANAYLMGMNNSNQPYDPKTSSINRQQVGADNQKYVDFYSPQPNTPMYSNGFTALGTLN